MSKVKIISNKQGHCPYCDSVNVNYESFEFEDDHIKYPAECLDCKRYFEEWFYLKFVGHNVGSHGEHEASYVLNKEINYD
jgi:hypothetical protein